MGLGDTDRILANSSIGGAVLIKLRKTMHYLLSSLKLLCSSMLSSEEMNGRNSLYRLT